MLQSPIPERRTANLTIIHIRGLKKFQDRDKKFHYINIVYASHKNMSLRLKIIAFVL